MLDSVDHREVQSGGLGGPKEVKMRLLFESGAYPAEGAEKALFGREVYIGADVRSESREHGAIVREWCEFEKLLAKRVPQNCLLVVSIWGAKMLTSTRAWRCLRACL